MCGFLRGFFLILAFIGCLGERLACVRQRKWKKLQAFGEASVNICTHWKKLSLGTCYFLSCSSGDLKNTKNFLAVLQQVLMSIRQLCLGTAPLALVMKAHEEPGSLLHSTWLRFAAVRHHLLAVFVRQPWGWCRYTPAQGSRQTPAQGFSLELHTNLNTQSNFCVLTSTGFSFYFSRLNLLKPSPCLFFFFYASILLVHRHPPPPILFVQLHPFSSFILSSKPNRSGLLSQRTSLPAYPGGHALNPSKAQSIFLGADKDHKEGIRGVSPGTRTAMLPFLMLNQNYPSHCVLMPHLSSLPGCHVSACQPAHTSPLHISHFQIHSSQHHTDVSAPNPWCVIPCVAQPNFIPSAR